MSSDIQSLVLDIGSSVSKVGFAGADAPYEVFPSLVWRPQGYPHVTYSSPQVGDAAISKRALRSGLSSPFDQNGFVTNWDDMESVYHHAFSNELRVHPEEHPVLLTELPFTPRDDREKVTQIMFETFNTPAMYVALQSVLSLYASGRTTGLVVEAGNSATHTVPVYEGSALTHAIRRLDVGGHALSQYMNRLLSEQDYYFDSTNADRDMVRRVKENLAYVSLDFETESRYPREESYALPDGRSVYVSSARCRCAEALFDPTVITGKNQGIHIAAFDSIKSSDEGLRDMLYWNITVAGGTSLLPGFDARLKKELHALAPPSQHISVTRPIGMNCKYSAWIGGAMLASLSTFERLWVSKEDYDNSGPSIVHRKCF